MNHVDTPSRRLNIIRAVSLITLLAAVLTSVAVHGPQPRLLAVGALLGVLCTLVALGMSRIPALAGWIVLPVVLIQITGLNIARENVAGASWEVFAQQGITGLFVYVVGLIWLRLGVIGYRH